MNFWIGLCLAYPVASFALGVIIGKALAGPSVSLARERPSSGRPLTLAGSATSR